MHTFAPKQNQPEQKSSTNLTRSNVSAYASSHKAPPLLHFQRTIGNQAVLRSLQEPRTIQPKLTVNTPADAYEQNADQVAARVMGMSQPHLMAHKWSTDRFHSRVSASGQ